MRSLPGPVVLDEDLDGGSLVGQIGAVLHGRHEGMTKRRSSPRWQGGTMLMVELTHVILGDGTHRWNAPLSSRVPETHRGFGCHG